MFSLLSILFQVVRERLKTNIKWYRPSGELYHFQSFLKCIVLLDLHNYPKWEVEQVVIWFYWWGDWGPGVMCFRWWPWSQKPGIWVPEQVDVPHSFKTKSRPSHPFLDQKLLAYFLQDIAKMNRLPKSKYTITIRRLLNFDQCLYS